MSPRLAYLVALGAVLVLSVALYPIRHLFSTANLSLFYVLLLFGIGLIFGSGPAAMSSVLAFAISDFFFYPPFLTFSIDKTQHVLGLLIFLVIGMGTGLLGSRLRNREADLRRQMQHTSMLYDLNRALIADVTLDQVLMTIVRGVVEIYGASGSRLLVPGGQDGGFAIAAAWPVDQAVEQDREAMRIAHQVFKSGQETGFGAKGGRVRLTHTLTDHAGSDGTRSDNHMLSVAVCTSEGCFGVLEVAGRPGGGSFQYDDRRMLKSFADQAALAMHRAQLIEHATRTQALEQSNQLKTALLAAVSHDLRTPLATIKMSASALNTRNDWDSSSRTELLSAIEESTDWLTLVVSNLLDLSRLEGGALRPERDWYDLSDLLQHVLDQMERQTSGHRITLALPKDLPLVFLDYVQISQVMMNVIGNAVKYSEVGTAIDIAACVPDSHDTVEIRIVDRGTGISSTDLPHIFDTFYRGTSTGSVSGSGLGLAICKGLVEAHGGAIRAESALGQGTTMTISLPLDEAGDAHEMQRGIDQ